MSSIAPFLLPNDREVLAEGPPIAQSTAAEPPEQSRRLSYADQPKEMPLPPKFLRETQPWVMEARRRERRMERTALGDMLMALWLLRFYDKAWLKYRSGERTSVCHYYF